MKVLLRLEDRGKSAFLEQVNHGLVRLPVQLRQVRGRRLRGRGTGRRIHGHIGCRQRRAQAVTKLHRPPAGVLQLQEHDLREQDAAVAQERDPSGQALIATVKSPETRSK